MLTMIFIKHVRNKIKSYYLKSDECYICGSTKQLEFHHLLCLSVQAKQILRKQGYNKYPDQSDPRFEELVWLVARDPDIVNPKHHYTLCKPCHKEIHKRFGQEYVAWKAVQAYIDKQRTKRYNK